MIPAKTMERRTFLTGLAASSAMAQTSGQRRPNILHIQSDQQQWATIASRSLCRTPNLNKLAEQGMLFERSYTPSAVCCPSRAMTLSGAYHWHNGVYNQVHSAPSVHRDLNADTVLYSQRLKAVGYQLGYVGKWHASWVRTPADFGYQVAGVFGCDPKALAKLDLNPDQVPQVKRTARPQIARTFQWPGSEPFPMWGYVEGEENQTQEWYSSECAIRMMQRFARASEPWLLEVQYVQPHDPYLPLKKYLDRYNPRDMAVPTSFHDTFKDKPGMHRREAETWGAVTEEDVRASCAHYYAATEQLDAQIGRVLKALDDTGQADNTIVVFTTDHGDMMGAHRMWLKGWIPYEEAYRVPLIIRWPGHIQPQSKTHKLVQLQDLAHTYVEAAGAPALPHPDGQSLLPLFRNPDTPNWRDQILCAYYGGEFLYTQRMAITERYKYVFNGFDYDELYDLEVDPGELHNIAYQPEQHVTADDMRARTYEMMRQFGDPYADKGPAQNGVATDRYGASRYLPRGKRLNQ